MRSIFILLALGIYPLHASAQTGSVGIGTTAPSDQLHTTGSVRFEKYSGTGTRLVQADDSGRLVISPAGATFSNNTAYSIPDQNAGANTGCSFGIGVTSAISIPAGVLPTTVPSGKLSVRVNIRHPFVSDLRVILVAPGGGTLVLAAGNGGNGDDFTNTVFADEASTSIAAATAPFTGAYKPSGNMSLNCLITPTAATFGAMGGGNIAPTGNWRLRVFDGGTNDTGSLLGWELSFSGAASFVTADQQNYIPQFSGGGLSPSRLFQAFSGNMGLGTITPLSALHISSASPAQLMLHNENDLDGISTVDLTFRNGNHYTGLIRTRGTSTNDAAMGFYTLTSTATNSLMERLTILDGGNVGVGNTAPTAKLDVAGDLHITSNARIDGTVQIGGGGPAAGKVLTAIGTTGVASWQVPAVAPDPAIANSAFYTTLDSSTSIYGLTSSASYGLLGMRDNASEWSFDDGSNFTNSPSRFTAPATGVYHADAKLLVVAGPAQQDGAITIALFKNGLYLTQTRLTYQAGDDMGGTVNISWTGKLATGDYLELKARQNVRISIALQIYNDSYFSGFRLY